jgi:adenylate cyclase
MKNNASKYTHYIAAISLVIIVMILESFGFFSGLNASLNDKLLPIHTPSSEIVIVAIDNESIQEIGVWPWPRSIHAAIIDKLTQYDAEVIGYDVTFSESSSENEDTGLQDALETNPNILLASEATLSIAKGALPQSTQILEPLGQFQNVANFGTTTLLTDGDGIVRRASLVFEQDGILQKSFALQIAELSDTTIDWQQYLDEHGVYSIPYTSGPESFSIISANDVISGSASKNLFENKIVLVGSTAPNLHDAFLTPMDHGQLMSGVELQANIIQGLQEGRVLDTIPINTRGILYLILAAALALISKRLRLRFAVPLTILTLFIYLLAANILSLKDLIIPVLYPSILIISVSTLDIAYRYFNEKKRRQWIRTAFERYLAPQVIEQIMKDEQALKLGGEKAELTILFSDIRSFTTISEQLSPEEVVSLLNTYLSSMTQTILDTQGVVDKFIGDAVMALWGAPIKQPDQATLAATTALKMQSALKELNKTWENEGHPTLTIGIGIHTGEVIVGNMGSEKRFDYTAIGDNVNLASRIESLTKQYGVMILISQTTKDQLPSSFATRIADKVVVKGRSTPVNIYELISYSKDLSKQNQKDITQFTTAFDLYQEGKWDEARTIFKNLETTNDDKLSELYVTRCTKMKRKKPSDWDGIFIATSK